MLSRVGKVAYRLELPSSSSLHPVFHVSQLRAAVGAAHSSPTLPPTLTEDLELMVEPEKLLDTRYSSTPAGRQMEVLLQWRNLPLFEATWERFEAIRDQFPAFNLEDKVRDLGGVMLGRM